MRYLLIIALLGTGCARYCRQKCAAENLRKLVVELESKQPAPPHCSDMIWQCREYWPTRQAQPLPSIDRAIDGAVRQTDEELGR